MDFIYQFYNILKNKEVKRWVDFLIEEGRNDSRFSTFFGVNYNEEDLMSVKLYFTYFDYFPEKSFSKMNFSKEALSIAKQHWNSEKNIEFSHQGFTLALKCYINNDEVKINPYYGFRSKSLPIISPKYISLTDIDESNPVGVCFEIRNEIEDYKNYYYLASSFAKKTVLNQFGIDENLSDNITLIEYTESNLVRKMNITFSDSATTKNFIFRKPHAELEKLSLHFFTHYHWYYYAPGIRINSNECAIYYIPKKTHYELSQIGLIQELYNNLP